MKNCEEIFANTELYRVVQRKVYELVQRKKIHQIKKRFFIFFYLCVYF